MMLINIKFYLLSIKFNKEDIKTTVDVAILIKTSKIIT
jgi:hypothetical protein